MKRTVIVNRKRFFISLSLGISLLNMFIFSFILTDRTNADMNNKTVAVTVGYGDTIWDLAENYGNDKTDIREAVYNIKKLNNLNDSQIHEGQVLEVPII